MFWWILLFAVEISKIDCDVTNMGLTMIYRQRNISITHKSENTENLRIKIHYMDDFEDIPNIDSIKKNVIEPAVRLMEKTLKPKEPMKEPLTIPRKCNSWTTHGNQKICHYKCSDKVSGVKIPEKYLESCKYRNQYGVVEEYGETGAGSKNTDLIVFLRSGTCGPGVLAFTQHIHFDMALHRPIAGVIQLCYTNSKDDVLKIENIKGVFLHELVHVLGFASQLYAYYRDEHGLPRTPRSADGTPNNGYLDNDNMEMYKPSDNTFIEVKKEVETMEKTFTKTVPMLVTPALVREARNHFGCPNLNGVFLEDSGSKINAYSHFESSYFQNELMLAQNSFLTFLSRFTLALLEDSGWYKVDYSRADNFEFGKNLGCDFINQSCYKYMKEKKRRNLSIYPYCDKTYEIICSKDRSKVEECSLYSNYKSSVPFIFRYFKDKALVSGDESFDYCPKFQIVRNPYYYRQRCRFSRNRIEKKQIHNALLPLYKDGKCLKYMVNWTVYMPNNEFALPMLGSNCYQYHCSVKDGFTIMFNQDNITCGFDGEEKLMKYKLDRNITVEGKFVCPSCKSFCEHEECNQKLVDNF